MTLFCTWFPIEPKDHTHDHRSIGFSRGLCFWRGSWVFRSFPLCLCGAGYRQSRATLNGNPKGRTTLKMGFPFAGSYLPRRKFIWSEDLLFSFLLSIIDRELFYFPLIFSFLLSSDLWSGILLFLFFSFFSFLPFFSFHFLPIFDWEFGF